MAKKKEILTILLPSIVIFGLSAMGICMPDKDYSDSERRGLAVFPKLSIDSVYSGRFMDQFESYVLDQFPDRDFFRKTKAITNYYILQNKDNNGYYKYKGHISKLEYPLNEAKLKASLKKQQDLYTKYIADSDCKVYVSVIPDKNYYLAGEGGYLSMDYDRYVEILTENEDYAEYIDIFDCLTPECYYNTDPHWRQEKIEPVAQRLCESMRAGYSNDSELLELEVPFYGAYYQQACLPAKPETIKYFYGDTLSECQVTYFNTDSQKTAGVYDFKKAKGKDAYEMFLSGAQALVEIENPNPESDKELILFRDSFGSSLAPLLLGGYKKVTLVDVRYLSTEKMSNMIDFVNQDVLFMYSTMTI